MRSAVSSTLHFYDETALLKPAYSTRSSIETIDNTMQHLKGGKQTKDEERFAGFRVGAGKDRFNEGFNRNGTTVDCKVSAKDTAGAMCVLEINDSGWPRHVNPEQDEWIYVVDGTVELEIGKNRFQLGARESMLIPRNVEHMWAAASAPARITRPNQMTRR